MDNVLGTVDINVTCSHAVGNIALASVTCYVRAERLNIRRLFLVLRVFCCQHVSKILTYLRPPSELVHSDFCSSRGLRHDRP